jgi:hypothetical protein
MQTQGMLSVEATARVRVPAGLGQEGVGGRFRSCYLEHRLAWVRETNGEVTPCALLSDGAGEGDAAPRMMSLSGMRTLIKGKPSTSKPLRAWHSGRLTRSKLWLPRVRSRATPADYLQVGFDRARGALRLLWVMPVRHAHLHAARIVGGARTPHLADSHTRR